MQPGAAWQAKAPEIGWRSQVHEIDQLTLREQIAVEFHLAGIGKRAESARGRLRRRHCHRPWQTFGRDPAKLECQFERPTLYTTTGTR